jgi:hypothetical protein
MDNRLREPRKKTCIDSNFIWLCMRDVHIF